MACRFRRRISSASWTRRTASACAARAPIKLAFAGQVFTRDFTMVGLGTVTGRVLNPDSSSAQGLVVNVNSLNPELGGPRSATTNAGGFYTIDNVPVGSFSVSTGDVARLLLGEGAGTIDADGATATVDILLVSNAVTPPVDAVRREQLSLRRPARRLAANGIERVPGCRADSCSMSSAAAYRRDSRGPRSAPSRTAGRELAVRQQGLAGLNVTRKVFVPRNGYFARYLDIFSNPTPQPVTIDVRVTSELQHTLLVKTSSGDAVLDVSDPDTADRWMVVDDATDAEAGVPATAFVFDGPGGARARRCGNAVVRIAARGDDRVAECHRAARTGSLAYLLLRRAAEQSSRGAGVRRAARPAPARGAGWIEPR